MKVKNFLAILTTLAVLSPMAVFGFGLPSKGAVYVMDNNPEGNKVVVFDRDFRGRLKLAKAYPTGGKGFGEDIDPLGSQGSLILSPNHHWLFAVNAGSDEISVFRVWRHKLVLIGKIYSGGDFPVSLALYHNLLYVLNAGAAGDGPNITGYNLNHRGELTPLPGSTRQLGSGGFHQVGFSPDGDALVITNGMPGGMNEIFVFGVDEDGLPDAVPTITPSAGVVPFAFIFHGPRNLLVAEAGSGAVSSYELMEDNTLEVIDASIANGNRATCWAAGTVFGTIFTANTASNNISSYKIKAYTGRLRLMKAEAGTGNAPIDMTITRNGRFLYVLNARDGSVGAFRILTRGRLKNLGTVAGLPPLIAQGIVAR